MTADVGLFAIDNCIQLKIEDGDLAGDEGIETAVIISLMSDARVSEDELPPGVEGRRGWWGDMFPSVEGDKIGSKLWALERRGKNDTDTLARIETAVIEALNWMIEDGVATEVSAEAELDSNSSAVVSIVIKRPTGGDDRFSFNWDAQEVKRA